MVDKWREEMAWIKAKVEADEEAIAEAERVVRALKKRRDGHRDAYRDVEAAFLRGDAELPPRQAELFPEEEAPRVEESPPRRHVPTTAADREPVRVARGSARAAAGVAR